LPGSQRGRLSPAQERGLRAHLAGCPACTAHAAAEAALTAALEESLPRYPASLALRRKLEARLLPDGASAEKGSWLGRRSLLFPARALPLFGAAAALLLVATFALQRREPRLRSVADETVSDHLRLLDNELQLQVVQSGIHEVKPWFAGRLDFAPEHVFVGDQGLPLLGGAVARFLDRKAALLVYRRREHRLSLFILRPEGLDFPPPGQRRAQSLRGFHLVLWRTGDLGYALVSDLAEPELGSLAEDLAAR